MATGAHVTAVTSHIDFACDSCRSYAGHIVLWRNWDPANTSLLWLLPEACADAG